jgi:acyl-CoA thioesterase-1
VGVFMFTKLKKITFFLLITLLVHACGGGTNSSDTNHTTNEVNETRVYSKIACVGDSITYGTNIRYRDVDSYPAQLQNLVGTELQVANFGVPGATLMKRGNRPYINTVDYEMSKSFQPDIVVIMLGTNDLKPANWSKKEEYVDDYKELIETYRSLGSKPIVYIAFPPPIFGEFAGIINATLVNELLPRIRQVSQSSNVNIIDNYTILEGKGEYFPDGVHPNAEGTRLIAENVFDTLEEYL